MFKTNLKKFLVMCMCTVITVGVASGCKKGGEETASDTIAISVSNWPMEEKNPETYKTYEGYLKEMERLYPEIEIIPSDYTYAINSFLPMAASGQLPNLYSVAFTEPQKLIENGYAKDITDIVKKLKYDEYIDSRILNIVSKDGRIYGIPTDGYAMALCYNMNVMKRAGMVNEDGSPKVPQTWEELAVMASEIKKKTGTPGFAMMTTGTTGGWVFMNIAWSYGVDFMEKIDGKWKATFNTPEAVKAIEFVRDLKWKYDAVPDDIFIDQDKSAQLIATEQVAIGFHDPESFAVRLTKEYNLGLDELAFSALPAGPKGRYTQIGGTAHIFSNETSDEQVEAGMKWLELIGKGVELTGNTKKNIEARIQANSANNYPVYLPSFRIWINDERVQDEKDLYKDYINVDPKLYKDTLEGVTLKEEEPVEAQHLYETLSSVIQEVFMNKDANIKALLDDANAKFQRDFLDSAN